MKLCTWNVNSIHSRLDRLLDFLKRHQPDVVCLQELKCTDENYPWDTITAAGYHSAVRGQKAYNGVAILAKKPLQDIQNKFDNEVLDRESRLIKATLDGCEIISAYCPNGSEVGSIKYAYKLEWFRSLQSYLKTTLAQSQLFCIAGDFNVAPTELDVYDPMLWQGRIHFSLPERAAIKNMLNLGLVDTFRKHHSQSRIYSWWDYRSGNYMQNKGLRIDLVLANSRLDSQSRNAWIDKDERTPREGSTPSDHAPVVVEFDNHQ